MYDTEVKVIRRAPPPPVGTATPSGEPRRFELCTAPTGPMGAARNATARGPLAKGDAELIAAELSCLRCGVLVIATGIHTPKEIDMIGWEHVEQARVRPHV